MGLRWSIYMDSKVMTIDEIKAASIPYSGRKYENMTVLQRLRCDLIAEAADYDHIHMHERNPKKANKIAGDELIDIAQNYAWRYAKHKMINLLDTVIEQASDNRITQKATIIEIMKSHQEGMRSDLAEYQQQFKNMELM